MSEVLEGAYKDLYMHRGADMTYVGMHTNIADSCAPGPDNCAPDPDSCAPDPDNCAPVYDDVRGAVVGQPFLSSFHNAILISPGDISGDASYHCHNAI